MIGHPGGGWGMLGTVDAFLGVDISSGRWAGVLLGDRRDVSVVGETIGELLERACAVEQPKAIAIDIPIGPPLQGVRACDTAARTVLKGRSSTLFTTPSLAALQAARDHGYDVSGYQAASAANLQAQGRGLSRQAYSLASKILEVHDWLAGGVDVPVVECHPEVCFANLASPRDPTPPRYRKTSWEGMRHRIQLLKGAGIDVESISDETGLIGADDLVDAAVSAWTARRYWAGNAVRYPASAEVGDAAIWA